MSDSFWPNDNLESWQVIKQSIDQYPDDEQWSPWKSMARDIICELEGRGLAQLFRIGQGMHFIMISTKDRHRLGSEPRVTLEFHPNDQVVRVAYGCTNIGFDEPETEERLPTALAVSGILGYLQRLWRETKPGLDVPASLNAA